MRNSIMPATSPGGVVHTVPERAHRNTPKEHRNADLHDRGAAGLRFHASLCIREGMAGISAFVRPGAGADAGRDSPDLLPVYRLVPGKARLACTNEYQQSPCIWATNR